MREEKFGRGICISRGFGADETLLRIGWGPGTREHDAAWHGAAAVRAAGEKARETVCECVCGLAHIESYRVSILGLGGLGVPIDVRHGASDPVHTSHLTRNCPDLKALEEHALLRPS